MATFTFDVSQPVQAPGPVGPQQAMVGTVGQGSAPRASVAPGGEFGAAADSASRTLDALVKMGQNLIAPKVQAEKTRMAMEGMVAALQGMSAAQIQEQEIFGGMFGDTVTVAAARQVEQMDAVNKFNIHLANNMQDLRKMDSMEFRKWFPEQMQQFMTGDDQSDALITQAFMESAPKVIDMHTKAHIGYRQEVAENAWSNDLFTAAAAMTQDHNNAAKGAVNPEFSLMSKQNFVARLAGPGGIHGEAYKTWINKAYRRLAAEGNIAALDLMEDTGVLNATQNDQQYEQLIKIRDRAEAKMISEAPAFSKYVSDLGVVEAALDGGYSGFESVEAIDKWALNYNKMVAERTGVSKPVIDNNRLAAYKERYLKGLDAAKRRTQGGEFDIRLKQATAHYKAGHYWNVYSDPELNREDVKNAVHKALIAEGNWEAVAKHAAHTQERWDILDEQLSPVTQLLTDGSISPGLQGSIQFLNNIATNAGTNAETVLGRYLGTNRAAAALTLLKYAGDGLDDPEKLNRIVKDYHLHEYKSPGPMEVSEAYNWVVQQDGAGLFNLASDEFAAIKPTEAGMQQFAAEIAPLMAQARKGYGRTLESAGKLAIGDVMHTMDWVGGFPMLSRVPPSEKNKTLHSAFNAKLKAVVPDAQPVSPYSEQFQDAIRTVIDAQVARQEEGAGFAWPWQESTVIGGQWLGGMDGIMNVVIERKDGVEQQFNITVDDVLDAYVTLRQQVPSVTQGTYTLQRDR